MPKEVKLLRIAMEAKAASSLADLEQLSRHLDLLHEELIDFENSLLKLKDNFPAKVIELVKSEVECEKSLLIICSYLNKRIEQCLRNKDLEELVSEENIHKNVWEGDFKDRWMPLSFTSQTQSVAHKSNEDKKPELAVEAENNANQSFFPFRRRRGPYRRYTENDKRKAINTALRLGSQNKAADILGLPIKNLKRWIKNGPVRRKGGRRTQDPHMEFTLIEWIEDYKKSYKIFPSSKDVRNQALQLSAKNKMFKASKGWFEKFMLRHYSDEFQLSRHDNTHSLNFKNTSEIYQEQSELPDLSDGLKKEEEADIIFR